MSKPFVSAFDSLGPSSVVREKGKKNGVKQHAEGGYNSNSPLTRTVFRFTSEFELPGFYCRGNHDKKGTKLPPPTQKKKRPGNPKRFEKKNHQSVKITK